VLWRPWFEWQLSFFFVASTRGEAAAGMLACAVAYAMLLVGYRTKLAQVASLICVLSLHTRTSFVNNGGDIVLGELALWTALLPSGRRFSLDALVARHRAGASGASPPAPVNRVVSLAVLGLTLQLAAIYLFNALNKTGTTWREGSVVHYMLFHSGIVTPLGDWARPFVTLRGSQLMTYFSWAVEALLPLLLLTPFARRGAHRLAVVLIVMLHTGFGLFLNLGVFVPAMIAFGLHFVPEEDCAVLERALGRLSLPRALGAVRARIHELAERLARVAPVEPSSFVRRLAGRLGVLREAAAGVLVVLLAAVVLLDNPQVTKLDREGEPTLARAVTSYLRFVQGWSMYAPDADKIDVNVYVAAVTAEGRRVDPFNEVASPDAPNPGPVIPPRLGQDNLFCAYALRIANTPDYQQAFLEWILRYPKRTGRPGDAIMRFEAFEVRDVAPPPGGGQTPTNTTARRFLVYP
jgi:hypothetical protein